MKRFSKKQTGFIHWKARGASTPDSVLNAEYSAKSRIQAGKIGYRLLQNVEIVKAIEIEKVEIYDVTGLTDEYILCGVKNIAENGKEESNRLRAWELLGKNKSLFKEIVKQEGDFKPVNIVNITKITPQQVVDKPKERIPQDV